ncbi:MAG: hypothetical protein JWP07_4196, partial [Pseudonocardiales bacterium]|nr:hypothetical protein [Pseudonocardiales bacterium]
MRLRRVVIPVGAAAAGLFTAGLVWFQPWKLWVDHRVDERLPAIALAPAPPSAAVSPSPLTPATASPSAPSAANKAVGPVLLSGGELISHEHPT